MRGGARRGAPGAARSGGARTRCRGALFGNELDNEERGDDVATQHEHGRHIEVAENSSPAVPRKIVAQNVISTTSDMAAWQARALVRAVAVDAAERQKIGHPQEQWKRAVVRSGTERVGTNYRSYSIAVFRKPVSAFALYSFYQIASADVTGINRVAFESPVSTGFAVYLKLAIHTNNWVIELPLAAALCRERMSSAVKRRGRGAGGPEFISLDGLRIDGRRSGEVRKIRCSLGALSRADGSAYFEQ
eukprot:IDg15552t1